MATSNYDAPLMDRLSKAERERVESLVGSMADSAEDFISTDIAKARVESLKLYNGDPLGTEESGRSQVVLTVVRDVCRAIMPSLMRIFTGPERYVEFRPRGKDDEPIARQKTDYINYILMEDNPGYRVLHDALLDGITVRTGIIKWSAEERSADDAEEHTGLTPEAMMSLLLDDTLRVSDVRVGDDGTYACYVWQTGTRRRVRIEAVPPDELYWSAGARSLKTSAIVGHVRDVPKDELMALGYTEEQLKDLTARALAGRRTTEEDDARRLDTASRAPVEDERDDETRLIRYDETYVRLKLDLKGDDDPRVRLYRVCLGGEEHRLLDITPVSQLPFVMLCPHPIPHAVVGHSVSDDVGMVQRVQSHIARGVLDSLALTLEPATEVVEGAVNMKDLLNPEIGRVVRVTQANAMREIEHRFVGADALAVLQYFDEAKENATGQSKAAAGLDADALQSSTKAAVAATLTASQQRIEMMARNFAEGLKELYAGLLRTVVEHQDEPRVVRLRGEYVTVDPRGWDATMDVVVNVALGAGMTEEKLQTLAAIAAKQEQVLQTLGPANPLVKLSQYRATLARMVNLSGFPNADEFFLPIPPEVEQQMEQAAAQGGGGGQNDPNAALAQAEIEKAKIQAEVEKAKIEAENARFAAEQKQAAAEAAEKLSLEQQRFALDLVLRTRELELKYQTKLDTEDLKAQVALEKSRMDGAVKTAQATIAAEASDTQAEAKVVAAEVAADAARQRQQRETGE